MMFKNHSLPIVLFLVLASFTGHKKSNLPKGFNDLKGFVQVPLGDLPNHDKDALYFFFENEVSNFDYAEFLYHIRANEPENLNMVNLNSELWLSVDADGTSEFAKNYHKLKEYPVVNLTAEAASAYCVWLQNIWNQRGTSYDVTIRLPTKEEWEHIATQEDGSEYATGNGLLKDDKNTAMARYKALGLPFGPAPRGSFEPSLYGLNDLCGNVSEMVIHMDKVYTKGGSWDSKAIDLTVANTRDFEVGPTAGFRPVIILKERM
ncbi:MAG: SUMF1/EgtB/PvdO family nonheme iron enzyme [Bacteroidia bacterium]|nr:SUMF1/EgtB/PvdO family nonheme iron enzyme [Bacteroidia bacterium]